MKNTILLVVDVQTELVKGHPYNEDKFISNIKQLIAKARETGTEIIYIRHDDGEGSELAYGSEGWEIYHEIAPVEGEKIFEKRFSSSFVKTGLKEYLEEKQIQNIVLVGMQTEYCMDATIKSAFEHGYKVILPEMCNTTFGNQFLTGEQLHQFYTYMIWNHRFGTVYAMKEVLEKYLL